jgi:AraC family transcriptional regulator
VQIGRAQTSWVETMLMNSLPTNAATSAPFGTNIQRPTQRGVMLPIERHSRFSNRRSDPANHDTGALDGRPALVHPMVEISPANIVKRRAVAWHGMTAEIIQATSREKLEYRFHGPLHLLAVCDQGVRLDGETLVEGLPRSSLRDLRKKFTFVPAGSGYYDWHEPRTLSRIICFYFDPARMPIDPETGPKDFAPRLYFEDATLWDTAHKLTSLIESADVDNQPYLEALGVVLAHELARKPRSCRMGSPVRGGLAPWQQRIVTTYIEEHLGEQVPLATLAQLVRLSPFYFCRAFKQSFGMPPHRYHSSRRIECAKALLAKPDPSVTEIGLAVGFNETSSFTAAFRKATGLTPTGYHRSLG